MSTAPEKPAFPVIREAVAAFPDKATFRAAVASLLAAGFKPTDLSVLATRQSLEIAGDVPGYSGSPGSALTAGLTDEVTYLAPLTIAGFALLSGGPVAAGIAAIVAGGLGGGAIAEVLERYAANRHSRDFAKALAAGAVLLWVRVDDPLLEPTAVRLLEAAGGTNAHVNARTTAPAG
jgi:hypothetical protein